MIIKDISIAQLKINQEKELKMKRQLQQERIVRAQVMD